MKKLNPIDELFKEGLGEPEISFNEDHWLAMEQRLDVKKKKRIIPLWLSIISGVAAALILVLFWLMPDQIPAGQKVTVGNKVKKPQSGSIAPDTKNDLQKPDDTAKPGSVEDHSGEIYSKALSSTSRTLSEDVLPSGVHRYIPSDGQLVLDTARIKLAQLPVLANRQNLIYTGVSPLKDSVVVFPSSGLAPVLASAADALAENRKAIEKEMSTNLGKSRVVLSILAAPDLSNVPSSGRSGELGINIGAQATIRLNSKFSVTSGISYAKKYYSTTFNQYQPDKPYTTSGSISNVAADCNVLDIPINVNYKVFEKRGNSITLSSGLSSYIMLRERYDLNYEATASNPAWQHEMIINNQNQHFLGIANLGVTFQHQINRRFSVSAQPFLKLPLTDIGYGNIRLKSSGMALSVNMNLLKSAKPKTVKGFKKR